MSALVDSLADVVREVSEENPDLQLELFEALDEPVLYALAVLPKAPRYSYWLSRIGIDHAVPPAVSAMLRALAIDVKAANL